jgi:hypothetical protein
MSSKSYELEIFDNLLNGTLDAEVINSSNQRFYLEKLVEKYPHFKIITSCDYKRNGESLKLIKRIDFPDFLLTEFYNQNSQSTLFNTHENLDILIEKSIQNFEFPSEEIISIQSNFRNSSKKIIICRKGDWKNFSINQLKYFYYYDLLNISSDDICKKIKKNIHDLDDNNKIIIYLDKLIQELNILIYDILNTYNIDSRNIKFPISENFSDTDFFMMVSKFLEKIQNFIEKHFFKYINDDLEVALTSKLIHNSHLNHKIDYICKYLLNSPLDKQLMDIIYSIIINLKERKNGEVITFRHFKYMTFFINELHNLIDENTFEDNDENIILRFLCEINFNTKRLFQFLENRMDYKLKMFESVKEKKSLIYTELKKISQLNSFTSISYCSKVDSVIEFVKNWYDQELTLMNQLEPLNIIIPFPSDDSSKNEKLEITLSVRELGVVLNYGFSIGIFKSSNKTEIINFFANHVKTNNTDTISFKSLQNSFYQNEEFTEENMQEILKKLLKNR